MTIFNNSLQFELASSINEAIKKSFPNSTLSIDAIYQLITPAPNIKMGHMAFPTFSLAKELKKSPVQIATEIAKNIQNEEVFQTVLAQGPYLNAKFTAEAYGKYVLKSAIEGEFKTQLHQKPVKVMVEYSQPNTHKILHVGHMRNSCLGFAIVSMLKAVGDEVYGVTYPGDIGAHVAKTLWYMMYYLEEKVPEENRGAWLGSIYTLATNKFKEFEGTEQEKEERERITQILKAVEKKDGEIFQKWVETREWSLDLMKEAYDWLGMSFDRWFYESEVDAPSIELVKKYLEKGVFIKDQGAIGMDLSDDKLGFCMLLKSDGTGLYATKDLELARIKFEEFGIEQSVYVVDYRQSHHFKQVFKVLSKMGFQNADKCYHLPYAMVELPDGAMSSRKGNIVPLMTLVASMEEKIKNDYLAKYKGEWSDEEIQNCAKMVANGAIKFGMLRVDNNRTIVFDLDEWLKLDGETGPYLQYVHARICSITNKFGGIDESKRGEINWGLLTHPREEELMSKLANFNEIVVSSAKNYRTNLICSYLYELGKLFNSFYADCSIGKAPNEEMKNARLALAVAVKETVKKGLSLLGIDVPQRM